MNNAHHSDYVLKPRIARRLLDRAARIWGVEHPDHIDPLIRLLVDIIAFELAGLGRNMLESDGKLLEKLAGLLLPQALKNPKMAHAVMRATPLEEKLFITRRNQFYIPVVKKDISGEETINDVFFSPLVKRDLIKGKADWMVQHDGIFELNEAYGKSQFASSFKKKSIPKDTIWLGLNVVKELRLEQLDIFCHFETEAPISQLLPWLPQAKWFLHTGEELSATNCAFLKEVKSSAQLDGGKYVLKNPAQTALEDIANIYKPQFLSLKRKDKTTIPIAQQLHPPFFTEYFDEAALSLFKEPCLWLKVVFPPAFPRETLENLSLHINCFPIINQRLHSGQLKLKKSTNIVPILIDEASDFCAVERVIDDRGNFYHKAELGQKKEENLYRYSVHHGDLERFDARNAKILLDDLSRTTREEGSVFAAFGQDMMMAHLENLTKELDAMEKRLKNSGVETGSTKQYLLCQPDKQAKILEYDYWSTLGKEANEIEGGALIQQYKEASLLPSSPRLLTQTMGGKDGPDPDEMLGVFRYAFLTRDRIVSKKDVQQFVLYAMGDLVEDVQIKNGVQISKNPKRGLVRTIDIFLNPKKNATLSKDKWEILITGLEGQINRRSISNANYRIISPK